MRKPPDTYSIQNRHVVLITNVKPGKLRDVMSAGLVCPMTPICYVCICVAYQNNSKCALSVKVKKISISEWFVFSWLIGLFFFPKYPPFGITIDKAYFASYTNQ